MKEISLHILDIVQNSITAGANLIKIEIAENTAEDCFTFSVGDNGCGMPPEVLERVSDPFVTGRSERRVGLGIPLLKHAAELSGGSISIKSRVGEGTVVFARFVHSHIDRQPLGDMAETLFLIISSNPGIDFLYEHHINDGVFAVDTREIKATLDGVPITEPAVMFWLSEYLKEGERGIA